MEIVNINSDLANICENQFSRIGYSKPSGYFCRNLIEQQEGKHVFLVAHDDGLYIGHVKLEWDSHYAAFREMKIPEIVDLNVLPKHRNQGIGSSLIVRCEELARNRSRIVGIGVGLHPGYNNAQRLYSKLGYTLDGNGVCYRDNPVIMYKSYPFDDDLVIYFTKCIATQ